MIEVAEKTEAEEVARIAAIDRIVGIVGAWPVERQRLVADHLDEIGAEENAGGIGRGAEDAGEQTEAVEVEADDQIVREAREHVRLLLDNFSIDVQEQVVLGLALDTDEEGEKIGPGADDDTLQGKANELARYIALKFSARDQERLYQRFIIEAKGEYAAYTPGNKVAGDEHLCYVTDRIVKAVDVYSPWYQRKALAKYIKEVLPEADAKHRKVQNDEIFDELEGDEVRGAIVMRLVGALHNVPAEKLSVARDAIDSLCDN